MPKRFSDTDIWKKSYYRKLPSKIKLLWKFMLETCDNAGVWEGDFDAATFLIGEKVEEDDFKRYCEMFEHRIEKFGDKFFLPGFVEFQYGKLSRKSQPHLQVIKLLSKHGLLQRFPHLMAIDEKDLFNDQLMVDQSFIKENVRTFVIMRDGKNCKYCHKPVNNFELCLDHVVPRSKGGSDEPDNLLVSCRDCSTKKGNSNLIDFLRSQYPTERALVKVLEGIPVSPKDKDKDKEEDKDKESGKAIGLKSALPDIRKAMGDDK